MVDKFSTKYPTMKHCAPNRTVVMKNAPKFFVWLYQEEQLAADQDLVRLKETGLEALESEIM